MKRIACLLIATVAGVSIVSAQNSVHKMELKVANYDQIRKTILINPGAAKWETIPWQPELGPAINEARKQDKPILLWMMNGNPVGMT